MISVCVVPILRLADSIRALEDPDSQAQLAAREHRTVALQALSTSSEITNASQAAPHLSTRVSPSVVDTAVTEASLPATSIVVASEATVLATAHDVASVAFEANKPAVDVEAAVPRPTAAELHPKSADPVSAGTASIQADHDAVEPSPAQQLTMRSVSDTARSLDAALAQSQPLARKAETRKRSVTGRGTSMAADTDIAEWKARVEKAEMTAQARREQAETRAEEKAAMDEAEAKAESDARAGAATAVATAREKFQALHLPLDALPQEESLASRLARRRQLSQRWRENRREDASARGSARLDGLSASGSSGGVSRLRAKFMQ